MYSHEFHSIVTRTDDCFNCHIKVQLDIANKSTSALIQITEEIYGSLQHILLYEL